MNAIHTLENAVKTLPYETELSFKQISVMAGVDVLTHRSIIACVNRHLARHHDRELQSIRGFGYKIISASKQTKKLVIVKDGTQHLITDVKALDSKEDGSKGLLITFRALKDTPEDQAIASLASTDSSIITILQSKIKG